MDKPEVCADIHKAFLRKLGSLMDQYDVEIFINDENEIRIDSGIYNEDAEPDLCGRATFFSKSSITAKDIDVKGGQNKLMKLITDIDDVLLTPLSNCDGEFARVAMGLRERVKRAKEVV